MNSNDKLNRSRPGRATKAALVARHARKCVICKHPEREAIEEQFVHWIHADRIVEDHDLPSQTNLYRHAHATGLFNLRRCNVRSALEHLIEESIHAPVTGDTVIRAVRALVHINAKGRWIEPPKELILSRRDPPGTSGRRSRTIAPAPGPSRIRERARASHSSIDRQNRAGNGTSRSGFSLPQPATAPKRAINHRLSNR